MNRENIRKAIAVMERARGSVNMAVFQADKFGDYPEAGNYLHTEAEMHACGNVACFAGWIAVSPEFHADGGACSGGMPLVLRNCLLGYDAVAFWLGIPTYLARSFVHGDIDYTAEDPISYSRFYEKYWSLVTADDVIAKLQALLDE